MEEESTTGRSVYSTTEISVASRDAITANVIGSAKSTIGKNRGEATYSITNVL